MPDNEATIDLAAPLGNGQAAEPKTRLQKVRAKRPYGAAVIREKIKAGDKKAGKKTAARKPKPKKAAIDAAKMTQRCTVCGYERKFVEYLTKEFKRPDGSKGTARWPSFETCPNVTNPELHPHYNKGRGVNAPFDLPIKATVGRKPDIEGVLFQLPDTKSIADAMTYIVSGCERRLGAAPKTLYVPEADYKARSKEKDLPEDVAVKPMDTLTGGVGYVYAVA